MVTSLLVILLALAPPQPLDPTITSDPDVEEGLLCWWTCMGLCLLAGKRHDQCEVACDDLCYTEAAASTGPTFGPDDATGARRED